MNMSMSVSMSMSLHLATAEVRLLQSLFQDLGRARLQVNQFRKTRLQPSSRSCSFAPRIQQFMKEETQMSGDDVQNLAEWPSIHLIMTFCLIAN